MIVGHVGRRTFVLGAAGAAIGCSRAASRDTGKQPGAASGVGVKGEGNATSLKSAERAHEGELVGATAKGDGGRAAQLDWSFEGASAHGGAERAVVLVPAAAPGQRFPVLIALHGRGEATRGAEAGAYGWVRDYRLRAQLDALGRGVLTTSDFQSFVAPTRLDALNASLATRPYEGLIVVCPHTPDFWAAPRALDAADRFGAWVTGELLARVHAECPSLDEATGIDGVSLGGRVAWLVGTANASAFRAVGTLQAAFQGSEVAALARRGKAYREARPDGRLRLLSSEGDPFKPVIAALHEALAAEGVSHEHLVVPGPHDYEFNRGPGGLEMLLWHDRVLRGVTPV